jgi:hypothetical protein
MAEDAVLCLKDESSALDVSLLIEISLCKKVGHEVAHVAGPKKLGNWFPRDDACPARDSTWQRRSL